MRSQTVAVGDPPHVPGARHRDRYGLPLCTSTDAAAAHYVEGVDRLLSWNLGAEECFEQAILADDRFALPHAGLALLRRWRGDVEASRVSADRARVLATVATRRERIHVDAIVDESPRALARLRE